MALNTTMHLFPRQALSMKSWSAPPNCSLMHRWRCTFPLPFDEASAPAPVATTLSGLLGVASLPPVAPSITAPHTAPHVAHVPALAQTAGAALSAAMTQVGVRRPR